MLTIEHRNDRSLTGTYCVTGDVRAGGSLNRKIEHTPITRLSTLLAQFEWPFTHNRRHADSPDRPFQVSEER